MRPQPLLSIVLLAVLAAAGCGTGTPAPTASGAGAGSGIILQAQVAASITGAVYQDANRNGVMDSTETGIPGVTVWLDNSISVLTTTGGMYAFAVTVSGAYTVEVTEPPGFVSTTPGAVAVEVTAGLVYRVDFGVTSSPAASYSITGTVFFDPNRNGVMDSGERGIAGVAVTLDGTEDVATDASGHYALSSSTLGLHTLSATPPPGAASTTPDPVAFTLTAEGAVVDFGMAASGEGGFQVKGDGARTPLNLGSKGVTPAVILGSATLEVEDIDPSTLRLEGVAPLRWSRGDVAGASAQVGDEPAPDGYPDLALKFDTQALAEAIGPAERGEVVTLHLSGSLSNGTSIVATDTVTIVKER